MDFLGSPRQDKMFELGDVVVCIHDTDVGNLRKGHSYVVEAIFRAAFDPNYWLVRVGDTKFGGYHQERFMKINV